MKEQINNISYLEKNMIAIHGNKLKIKNANTEATLSKNQRILLICLMKGINEKRRIIELVWGGEDVNAKEMHYHQLIHKTRTRLTKKGFPNDFIMTIPRYGLCLNKDFLHSMLVEQDCKVSLKNKPPVLI